MIRLGVSLQCRDPLSESRRLRRQKPEGEIRSGILHFTLDSFYITMLILLNQETNLSTRTLYSEKLRMIYLFPIEIR